MKYESNQTYLWVLLYIKTHCVILTAIYQNIGHMNWLPVRGNKLEEHVNAQRNWP